MPLLGDDYILLRSLEPEDLDFLYSCENDTTIWKVSNTLTPYSRFVLKQYLANAQLDIYTNKQLRLIIAKTENPQNAIGAVDLFDFDPFHQRAGIGILILQSEERNQGYATHALKLLIDYCFSHLHLHQLYANIGASNCASIQLFEKTGFAKAGTKAMWNNTGFGWEDEHIYQLIK